jgi:hypothetical protein
VNNSRKGAKAQSCHFDRMGEIFLKSLVAALRRQQLWVLLRFGGEFLGCEWFISENSN